MVYHNIYSIYYFYQFFNHYHHRIITDDDIHNYFSVLILIGKAKGRLTKEYKSLYKYGGKKREKKKKSTSLSFHIVVIANINIKTSIWLADSTRWDYFQSLLRRPTIFLG